jgi:ferric-dicitrate binding protein FerR (iron transport regulator)
MAYVPMIPPTERTRMSARARELATQLERAIQEFQRSYPDTPAKDIREALRALSGDADRAPASRRALAGALAGGIAALIAAVIVMEESGGGLSGGLGASGPWIAMVVIVFFLVVMRLRRR